MVLLQSRVSSLLMKIQYVRCHEKTGFLHMQKLKVQISFAVTAKLISAFVFATQIIQLLFFLNLKRRTWLEAKIVGVSCEIILLAAS